jgi:predicted RNase H-like HicB family nuclease
MAKQKTLEVLEYDLPFEVNKDPSGGFVARSTIWKDCYAQGDSIDEVTTEIASVAASLIELYKEEGQKVPLKRKRTRKTVLKIPVYTA